MREPERLSRWWALEYPDFSLDNDIDGDEPGVVYLVLYAKKSSALAARQKIVKAGVPPYPTVISITLS